MKNVAVTIAALAAIVLGGCEGTRYPVIPVQGRITFADGQPLPKGTQLAFIPAEGGVGTASAITAEDGSFKVKHERAGSGMEAGKYIALLKAPEGDSGFYAKIPKEYYDGGVISIDVRQGMESLDLKVKPLTKRR